MQVSAGALTLTPDQAMLTDPATDFPVYIDPVYKTVTSSANLMVSSGGWKDYDFKGDEGMGYCPYSYTNDCGVHHVKRLFYRMPTSGFGGKTIMSAEFQVKETFAPSCTTRTVQLWKTKTFGTSSTWSSTSDNWLTHLDSQDTAKGYSGCPSGDVILDATSAMKEAAAGSWSTLTLGLRAATEDDQLGWKRFDDDPALRVRYNTPPPQPPMKSLSSSPGGGCAGPDSPARINKVPTAYATLTDPDGDKLSGEFQVSWDDGSGWASHWTSAKVGPYSSGTRFQAVLPATIPEGVKIGWSARAYDGMSYSPWSYSGNATACYFIYDHTAPAPPTITSPAYSAGGYPESQPNDDNDPWYAGVGRYGTFTFTAADTDVVKYTYGVIGDPAGPRTVVTAAGAPQTVQVMPTSAGVNVLQVSAVDGAQNTSTDTYAFRVSSGADAKAAYALDEPIDSAQVSDTSGGNPATVHGGVTLGVDGITAKAMQLNGTDGYAATSSPLLDTTKSFSVSAWARLTAARNRTTRGSSRRRPVRKRAASSCITPPRWIGGRSTGTPATPLPRRSFVPPRPRLHKVVSGRISVEEYGTISQTLTLYVNGALAQTVAYTTPWNATGDVHVGTSSFGPCREVSSPVTWTMCVSSTGSSPEKRPRTCSPSIRWWPPAGNSTTPAATVRAPKAYWKMDEASGATRAEDTQGAFPAGTHGGASFGTTGKVGKALHLPGSTGYAQTTGPVVDSTKSFWVSAWARLTTKTVTPVVVSQDGTVGSAFQLYYSSNYDRWIFKCRPRIHDPDLCPSAIHGAADLNTWTHLAGVYDAGAQQIRLYVDGKLSRPSHSPTSGSAGDR